MAILVKVSGSSLGIFFIQNKNRHEKHKGHAMIFMYDKKCQTASFGQIR